MEHTVLYGVVIQDAIAKGNLQEMKNVAQQAEQHLSQWGDVHSALQYLKIEIAKLEGKHK
jgi:Domain of unknown function (DUF1843)